MEIVPQELYDDKFCHVCDRPKREHTASMVRACMAQFRPEDYGVIGLFHARGKGKCTNCGVNDKNGIYWCKSCMAQLDQESKKKEEEKGALK